MQWDSALCGSDHSVDSEIYRSTNILFSVCPAVPQSQSVVSLHQLCLLELPGEELCHQAAQIEN